MMDHEKIEGDIRITEKSKSEPSSVDQLYKKWLRTLPA